MWSEVGFYWSIGTNNLIISEEQSEAVGRRTENTMAPRKGTGTIYYKTIHRILKILELEHVKWVSGLKLMTVVLGVW